MRATTQALIAFLVVSLALPARSFAAPPDVLVATSLSAGGPKISVVVVSLDAKASAQQGALEAAAEEALIRASRFTVLLTHEAFNPEASKKRNEALGEAVDMVKFGMKSLEELDNVKATESFTAAIETLETGDLSRDFTALLEAWIMKAAGHATGGENVPAKKDIESIIGLNAKAEFTPTYFPPELLKFTEAQRKLVANAKGELLVRTEPAGARVWVDGIYRGVSPVNVAGLTANKHYVTATLGGFALGQSQASPGEELISLAPSELAAGFKKAITDIKKDPEGVTRDAAAQQLGKAAQLDQVFLVLAKKSVAGEKFDLIALRLETRDQHNLAYKAATVSPTDPEALAAFFDSLTGRDAKRDGKEPLHHFKGGGGSDVKTIAGVSLLGLAGVSAVTGVVFGVMAGNNAAQYKLTPQTRSFDSANLARDGRTFSVVADISYLVAIAAGATGGVLLLTNKAGGDDASAEPTPKNAKDDAKRRDAEKRAAEERRASEERAKEDERRREDEKKREEERRNQKGSDAKAAEEKKKADEEAKKAEEEAAAKKKAEDEANANKKLSKKEQRELEKKKKEEERQAKKDEEQRKKDEERQRKEDEKKAAEEKKKQEADEKAAAGNKTKKQKEEEEKKKKEEEEAAAAKKKADDEAAAAKQAEEDKKKAEEEKKKKDAEKKKKDEDHDDLRNF